MLDEFLCYLNMVCLLVISTVDTVFGLGASDFSVDPYLQTGHLISFLFNRSAIITCPLVTRVVSAVTNDQLIYNC